MGRPQVTASPPNGDGTTPLDRDELNGLKPQYLVTRNDLNRVEQQNITRAVLWSERRRLPPTTILSDHFLRELHRQMFHQVWSWAGTFRTTERNIGWPRDRIATGIRDLLDDASLWILPETSWITAEESIIRFHHRLVAIHPFPNGN
ncbi:MAG: mobile mystery protein B, partial [Angustibacter sp.]